MFIVNKCLPDSGARSSVFCGGLEHKMGIKGSDLVQLMTPVVKAFLTDEGFNNTNLALQVMGGSGFTTDWPVEQLVRDGRIARIYEGTNGIQAMDLVGRKLGLAGGRLVTGLFDLLEAYLDETPDAAIAGPLRGSLRKLRDATNWIVDNGPRDPEQAGAAATPYLRVMALTEQQDGQGQIHQRPQLDADQ